MTKEMLLHPVNLTMIYHAKDGFDLGGKKSFRGRSTTKNLTLFIVEVAGLLHLRTILLFVNNVLLKAGKRSTYIGMLYLMTMPDMLL